MTLLKTWNPDKGVYALGKDWLALELRLYGGNSPATAIIYCVTEERTFLTPNKGYKDAYGYCGELWHGFVLPHKDLIGLIVKGPETVLNYLEHLHEKLLEKDNDRHYSYE